MKFFFTIPWKKRAKRLIIIALICFISSKTFSQLISIYVVQNMQFGAFYTGNTGGSVTVSNTGVRSSTGTIVPLSFGQSYNHAIVEVEAALGLLVSVSVTSSTLTGSNGGTMPLSIGSMQPTSPFLSTKIPPARTQVKFGGTLTVGDPATTPGGAYSGSFTVMVTLL